MLKTFIEKRIPENRTQNWLWNSYLYFTAKEMRPLNSPEFNPPDYDVRENIRVNHRNRPKPNSDELKEMLQMTLTQDTIDRAVKEF